MKQKNFRKSNAGFTLVELIVVIAIMAILAGVGTVGYSAYIKSANKGADKKLVGEYVRAIETAGNSYLVEYEGVQQAADVGAQLPIGFVVLTENGTQCLYADGGETCTFVTCVQVCKSIDEGDYGIISTKHGFLIKDSLATNISICTAHSDVTIQENITYTTKASRQPDQTGTIAVCESGKYYKEGACPGGTSTDGLLNTALKASYGDTYTANSLKYDGWSMSAIPTFWTSATDLMDTVSKLSSTLHSLCSIETLDIGNAIKTEMSIGEHTSAADYVYDIANAIADPEVYANEDAFATAWLAAVDSNDGVDYAFGINNKYQTREYYSAIRAAYNNGFASYLKSRNEADLATKVEQYGRKAGSLIAEKVDFGKLENTATSIVNKIVGDAVFPSCICNAAFANKTYMTDGWTDETIAKCKNLYEEYVKSDLCEANGRAFYQSMLSAANYDNGGNADISSDNSDKFFSDYNLYLEKFELLYKKVNEMSGNNAVVISVYYNTDGTIGCDVSPTTANPRND